MTPTNSTRSSAKSGPRALVKRYFTSPDKNVWDTVIWEKRDAVIPGREPGAPPVFEQLGVEFPATWSQNSTNIVAQKYFAGQLGTPEREYSVKQLIGRVVDKITVEGDKAHYFGNAAERETFRAELTYILLHQMASFNSPVWFNIGVEGVPQQASACFILSVEDTLDDILEWYREEGKIFQNGSGAGLNLSALRASREPLSRGGHSSGPVTFMRGADASAGTITSGGRTRRAAKMVILNIDHPDIQDFIWCKADEEKKARALAAAGFDMSLNTEEGAKNWASLQYQNANNSVRVSDAFMQACEEDRDWYTTSRTTGERVDTYRARDLMRQLSEAAWQCADPGVQYDSTINNWHTTPSLGPITGSNPCSEYMSNDDTSCNLASLNLMKFLNEDGGFDDEAYDHVVRTVFTAQDILICFADYPTDLIGKNTRRLRQIGIGYANLGALLMASGLPYDSDEGRDYAAAITSALTGLSYSQSALIADRLEPIDTWADDKDAMTRVMEQHLDAAKRLAAVGPQAALVKRATRAWKQNVKSGREGAGFRNSQASVLAPTGCLDPGTLVMSSRGLVRLGRLGDTDGRQWQDITDLQVQTDEGPRQATKFYVNGVENVVRLRTARGYEIVGTPKHRIRVVDAEGQRVWRRFGDIRKGDVVPMMRGGMFGSPQAIWLPPLGDGHWLAEPNHKVPEMIDANLAELVGYFMGDGSLHAKGLRLCVSAQDTDVVDRLVELGRSLFGIEACIVDKQGYTSVEFNSVRLATWWQACGFAKMRPHVNHSGKGYTAHVPDAILATNDTDVYGAFIRGLVEADGSATHSLATWTTSCEQFGRDVQAVMLALGIVASRHEQKVQENRLGGRHWRLRVINANMAEMFMQKIGFISQRKNECMQAHLDVQSRSRRDRVPMTCEEVIALTDSGKQRSNALQEVRRHGMIPRDSAVALVERDAEGIIEDRLAYYHDTVDMIELAEEQETFDISVPDNVTYVANGFVSHNTISFMMDCDTTGIEPDFSLVKMKKLVGGGTMQIVNQTVPMALRRLGYTDEQIRDITTHIAEHFSVLGAPHLSDEHQAIFACAVGENAIHYMGHLKMMAACQPFLSGAISKTVNLPENVTVEDIYETYMEGWRLGLKAVAIYRDGTKVAQPMATDKSEDEAGEDLAPRLHWGERRRLPREPQSLSHKFKIHADFGDITGYFHLDLFEDGTPGQIFINIGKAGDQLRGWMDVFSVAASMSFQYGMGVQEFIEKFAQQNFSPQGVTDFPSIRTCRSIVDYLAKWLALNFLDEFAHMQLGIGQPGTQTALNALSARVEAEQVQPDAQLTPVSTTVTVAAATPAATVQTPLKLQPAGTGTCPKCNGMMQQTGKCMTCMTCGETGGCG